MVIFQQIPGKLGCPGIHSRNYWS